MHTLARAASAPDSLARRPSSTDMMNTRTMFSRIGSVQQLWRQNGEYEERLEEIQQIEMVLFI